MGSPVVFDFADRVGLVEGIEVPSVESAVHLQVRPKCDVQQRKEKVGRKASNGEPVKRCASFPGFHVQLREQESVLI